MTKKFWAFIGNDKYDIGITDRTVYVYDKSGTELAAFKDLTYAYKAVISPLGDIFVVKTTDGRLAIYSFEPLKLVKKFYFSKVDCAQDENMIFSPDGKYFYNIENHARPTETILAKYKTDDFSLVSQLLTDRKDFRLLAIDYDKNTDCYYVSGFLRNFETKIADTWFVGKLVNDELVDMRYVTENEENFGNAVVELKQMGCTEKAFEWSPFQMLKRFDDQFKINIDGISLLNNLLATSKSAREFNDRFNISLDEVRSLKYSLATMWENASTTPLKRKK